ncbi:restriction endonuclease subunit S [Enterococcus hirae]|uniref:restriction endonuclease subunit S n=1 Tax=Enterococcus hirae TaxID=1354 RepID=UPI0014744034|nr:restriction endonuclease subunit S [Enterococcus hirae]EMF0043056.1 restriction endonuclease subunit S [Enterococcus hirae]EMF0119797.1 restriction endonuclease subunit S [Enterococcus hirae]NME53667.1 restriction endonuclease subunit S [Enterococcus hirae]
MSNDTQPEIRFPGSTEDWELRKLGEILVLLKDGTHGTHKDVDEGMYLLSAKNIKNGKINIDESDRIISEDEYKSIHKNFNLEKGDVLLTIVGSIGEAAVLENPFKLTFQRSVAYLRPNGTLTSQFLYTTIMSTKFQRELKKRQVVSAQPGIYLGDLSMIPIELPCMEEQQKIGTFFKQLDDTITLHQRKLDLLKETKKGFLQKMFPKNGAKVPEIRFPGFTGDWEQRKLGDVLTVSKEKNKSNSYSKEQILSVSREVGTVNQIEYQGRSFAGADISGYKIVYPGQLIYTKSPLKGAPYGIFQLVTEEGIVSPLYAVYNSTEQALASFIGLQLKSDNIATHYLSPLVSKGAKNTINITDEGALDGRVTYPTITEQQKIVAFFKQLENTITLHQRKLDLLKETKKGFLQKMFV